MKISNRSLLKTIFDIKGNFAIGETPAKKVYHEVEVAAFKNGADAGVSISADFELNWAFRSRNSDECNLKGVTERNNFSYILSLLEDYSFPITWATVGHLFLCSCDRRKNGVAHPKMFRPHLNDRWKGDWYKHDPCTNLSKDPLWYAPDLIQEIVDSKVAHEIGTHSFSHIDFSPKYSNKELIRCEIEECIKVMEPFGLKPRSLVFPFNRMEYSFSELLSDLNIIAVRHRDKKIRISYPKRTKFGIYKIYESMNLRSPVLYDYLDKAKIFIEEAAKRQAGYHLWFHPSDPLPNFKKEFRTIIEHICNERERGRVWVATMGDLAAYCEAREKMILQVQKQHNEVKVYIESSLETKKYGSPEVSLIIYKCDMPQNVLIKNNNCVKKLSSKKIFLKKNQKQLIINIPSTSKMITLIF